MDQPTPKDQVQEAPQGEQGADWTNYQLHLPEADTKACKTDKPSAASGLVKPDDIVLSFDEPSCNKKGGDLQTLTDSSQILPIYTGVDDSGKPIDKVDNSDGQDDQDRPAEQASKVDSPSGPSDLLLASVDKRLGQSLDVANRRLGCTTAVSQVLSEIDPEITVTSNNRAFARDLEAHGYERVPLAEIKPGDVIIGKRPDGMPGHSAIYMGDGKVFNNNSNSQQMQIDGVEKFSQGMHDQNGRWNKNGFSETVVYRKAQATSGADDQAAVKPEGGQGYVFAANAGLDQVKPIRPILDVTSLQLGTELPSYKFQPGVNLTAPIQHSGDSQPFRLANNTQFTFTPNAGLDQVKPIRPILDFSSVRLGTDTPAYSFQPGVNLGAVSRHSGDEPTD